MLSFIFEIFYINVQALFFYLLLGPAAVNVRVDRITVHDVHKTSEFSF